MKKIIFTLLFLSLFFLFENNIFGEVSKFNTEQVNSSIPTNYNVDKQNALLPLSGSFSIGADSSCDYSSFTSAVLALDSNGINGPVMFLVKPGNYSEQITIPPITAYAST